MTKHLEPNKLDDPKLFKNISVRPGFDPASLSTETLKLIEDAKKLIEDAKTPINPPTFGM
mgnify:CR=1 FL=1